MPDVDDTKRAIAAMLRPTSIAVVGATDRLQYGGRLVNRTWLPHVMSKLRVQCRITAYMILRLRGLQEHQPRGSSGKNSDHIGLDTPLNGTLPSNRSPTLAGGGSAVSTRGGPSATAGNVLQPGGEPTQPSEER